MNSSVKKRALQLDLVLSIVEYKSLTGQRTKKGLCSNYLAKVDIGAEINLSFRGSSFHLKQDTDSPILLIGAGSGIAPFRGFWQQKQLSNPSKRDEKTQLGKQNLLLIFGCRNDAGNLLINETTALSHMMKRQALCDAIFEFKATTSF